VRAADEKALVSLADAIGGRVIVLRKGRREPHVVRVRQ
jgi:hypothetical protein